MTVTRSAWSPIHLATGFVTNFFDTLGIGSFAPTTAFYRLRRLVPDDLIPGTLNLGHALPTILQAIIFIRTVDVEIVTLLSMIAAAVAGAWLGSGVVSRMPLRAIRFGMGTALIVAAIVLTAVNLNWLPSGGEAKQLRGGLLVVAVTANFCFGSLMALGIGLYAPCMILVSLLGMNPVVAFPIMMGSCACLMPVAGMRFLRAGKYHRRAAAGLALGGIPAVLIAGLLVRSMSVTHLRWLVVVVVVFAGFGLLRAAVSPAPGN